MEEIDIKKIFNIISQRKNIIIITAIFLIAIISGSVYTLKIKEPLYLTKSRVIIENQMHQ